MDFKKLLKRKSARGAEEIVKYEISPEDEESTPEVGKPKKKLAIIIGSTIAGVFVIGITVAILLGAFHTHTFGDWVLVEESPNSTEGVMHRYCTSCDYFESSSVSGLPHNHNNYGTETLEAIAPTCTTTGLSEGVSCLGCGEAIVHQDVIPALGHTYSEQSFPPTCAKNGYLAYTCLCGDSYTVDKEPALGHKEVIDEGIEETCSTDGLTEGSHCSECNEVLIAQEIIPASHEWISDYGWNKDGHWLTCSICTVSSLPEAHSVRADGYCTVCGNPVVASVIYQIAESGDHFEVIGYKGEAEILTIANEHNGLPVTHIANNAFKNCTTLKSISIPDSITSIGYNVFTGCSSLEFNRYDNATYLGNENNPYLVLMKASDVSITACNIHRDTKLIHIAAFADCKSLMSITIPEGVTSIGNDAFSFCTGLLSVTIPSSVTSIGFSAFSRCSSLTVVDIPEGVTSIGDDAFLACTSLINVFLPESVTSIGGDTFYGCDSLIYNKYNNAYYLGNRINPYVALIEAQVNNVNSSCVVHSDTKIIADKAFSYCYGLTAVSLSDKITSIGAGAFNGCDKLTDINYDGTCETWFAISKGDDWDAGATRYTVYCTDGIAYY